MDSEVVLRLDAGDVLVTFVPTVPRTLLDVRRATPDPDPAPGPAAVDPLAAVAARIAADGVPVHPGLEALLDLPEAAPLLRTLETYLELAGSAQATAEALHLHRTSLYYRLQRVELLAGTDLKNGTERLALHLALKVARAAGRLTGP
ncbi:PucR C-terminal helix-turn-helix domain-containing protein [Promicromonospora umidemergens]|uniref:PucR C-terminal helix-turn-helix domain-containing protein n=1 Tax=Promicromonospora umidemergens TaxID=629679 RepID=A0ABP8WBQ9_9MICO|nr:helix-turn-helix domain-containing protein [Promicromonospora umidemergens]MCP2284408.1 PucR C-terminal helix-turn-helix domain-containing protein [Promicromonospora umidemergens]